MKLSIKSIKKKTILKVLFGLIVISIPLLINMAFFRPTKLNAFIASKVYKEPANSAFTDDNFYKCVVDAYNNENDASIAYTDSLSDEQLKTIKELECSNDNIYSAVGVEKLDSLQIVSIESENYKFQTLSFKKNNKLETAYLNVPVKQLTLNPNIKQLALIIFEHTNVDFSILKSLSLLYLAPSDLNANINFPNISSLGGSVENIIIEGFNKAEVFDFSNFSKIQGLMMAGVNIKTLSIPKNLVSLGIDSCQIFDDFWKKFSISQLKTLSVNNVKLNNFNLERFPDLESLWLTENNLTTIDVSGGISLKELELTGNKLTEIDVSKLHNLVSLGLQDNNISNLNLQNNVNLVNLNVKNNNITSLDLTKNEKMRYLNINGNNLKKELFVYQGGNIDFYNDLGFVKFYDYSMSDKYMKSNIKTSEGSFVYIDNSYTLIRWNSYNNEALLSTSDDSAIIETSDIKFLKSGSFKVQAKYALKYFHNYSEWHIIELGSEKWTYSGEYTVNVIQAMSNIYTINDNEEYIYIGNDTNLNKIKNNINVPEGVNLEVDLENNKLQVMWEENVLKEFTIKSIDFGNLKAGYGMIGLSQDIPYEEFVDNITTNGVTYKIFDDEEEVTSGNITKGMKLKVYLNEEPIDEYQITDEYLEFDESLNINEEDSVIFKLKEGMTVSDILSYISTSGEIKIKNNAGNIIGNSDIIGTGYKIIIELSSERVEYTLVVSGDVTKDGIVNIADVLKMADHTISKDKLTDYELYAAEVTNDTNLNIADVVKIADYTLDKRIEIWR